MEIKDCKALLKGLPGVPRKLGGVYALNKKAMHIYIYTHTCIYVYIYIYMSSNISLSTPYVAWERVE